MIDSEPDNLTHIDLVGRVVLLRLCWVARDEWDRVQDGMDSTAKMATDAADAIAAEEELLLPPFELREAGCSAFVARERHLRVRVNAARVQDRIQLP